jgi:hypothetical protein
LRRGGTFYAVTHLLQIGGPSYGDVFKEFRPLIIDRDLLPVGTTALPAPEVVQLKHQGPVADVAETLHQPQLLALDGKGMDPAEIDGVEGSP